MSNNAFDNSHQASLNRGTQAAQQNHPQPTQKPGQSWDSHATEVNQYNHTLNKK